MQGVLTKKFCGKLGFIIVIIMTEKSKTLTKSAASAPFIRRTASVDTIYLLGQWQRDALYLSYCGRLMMDRATQTPEEFEDVEKKTIHKKTSVATGDQLEMKFIRKHLQRTNHNSRGSGPSSSYQRHSPVHGDHFAISSSSAATSGGTTSPILPSSAAISPPQLSYSVPAHSIPTPTVATVAASCSRAVPIPIPDIPKPLIPRMRSSVEGLNQEIERLVLKEISSLKADDIDRTLDPTPEGHRAPIADLFRVTHSVDTQTPYSRGDSCHSSNSPLSRSQSVSPAVPIIPGQMDGSRPSSAEENRESGSPDVEGFSKLATSPHINKFLAREPPDGCEKVKIAEEARNSTTVGEPHDYGCPKPSVNFVLLPSQSSAFYPLCKNCVMSNSEETAIPEHSSSNSHSSASERLQ